MTPCGEGKGGSLEGCAFKFPMRTGTMNPAGGIEVGCLALRDTAGRSATAATNVRSWGRASARSINRIGTIRK